MQNVSITVPVASLFGHVLGLPGREPEPVLWSASNEQLNLNELTEGQGQGHHHRAW